MEKTMGYTREELRRIWKSTDGRCHLTGERLRLGDYGTTWEVDHSRPRARGGSDHGNNLKPATISANRSKQDRHNRIIRAEHGLTRSPMSAAEQERVRRRNSRNGAAAGALLGSAFGPGGALVGFVLGSLFGSDAEVE